MRLYVAINLEQAMTVIQSKEENLMQISTLNKEAAQVQLK